MKETNPYAVPKAEILDLDPIHKRTKWVWAITIFYIVSVGLTVVSFVFIFSGAISIPDNKKQYFANLTVVDHVLGLLVGGVNLVAAIQLFRLRKMGSYLFLSALALGLVLTIWHAATKGWLAATGNSGLIGTIFGWGIAVAVCVYSWCLNKAGILK